MYENMHTRGMHFCYGLTNSPVGACLFFFFFSNFDVSSIRDLLFWYWFLKHCTEILFILITSFFGWFNVLYCFIWSHTHTHTHIYGATHKRCSVAKLIKAVSTELSEGIGKNNRRKQKSQWVNVDIITGLGGAFWSPEGKVSWEGCTTQQVLVDIQFWGVLAVPGCSSFTSVQMI